MPENPDNKISLEERLDSLRRRAWAALTSLANLVALAASLLAVVGAIWVAFFKTGGDLAVPIERYALIAIFFSALFYYAYRASRSERASRYRHAFSYVHNFHHHIRDFHEIINSNRDCVQNATDLEKVSRTIKECRLKLQEAADEIKFAYELITGKRIRVCVKYCARSERNEELLVARTLIRDRFTLNALQKIDEEIRKNDLDDIDRNTHFGLLTDRTNDCWDIRFNSKKKMEKAIKDLDVRRGYRNLKKSVPVESIIMASICVRPWGTGALDTALSMPAGEKLSRPVDATSSGAEMSGVAADAAPAPEQDDQDPDPKVTGIVFVDSPDKKAFRGTDVDLLHSYADALFWAISQLNRLTYEKIRLEGKTQK